jgi:uncharacterized LabA/DUF88 family protein
MQLSSVKTPIEFSREIEKIITEHRIEYLDAIMLYVEKNNIDVEVVASLVKYNSVMKSKLEDECQKLNLLEKTSKLPL